jgi:hypothetical protein
MKSSAASSAPLTLKAAIPVPVPTLGTEDAARINGVRLAHELELHDGTVDLAGPGKAGCALREARPRQVVVERSVGLFRVRWDRDADDEVDVGRAYVQSGILGQPPDQVARRQSANEVDPFVPGSDVSKQGDQRPFASISSCLVVFGMVFSACHQKPMTICRR